MSDLISEAELANRVGVSRKILREYRAREMGASSDGEWRRKNRVIYYTEAGVRGALEAFKNGLGGEMTPDDKKLLGGPVVERLTFVRGGFGNRQIIIAKRENGERVPVRVKDSSHFRLRQKNGEPMSFGAVPEKYGWVMKGPPPRGPGKW